MGRTERAILGAVLAGGDSRRMGRDKALLEISGRLLVHRLVAVLKEVFAEVVLMAPPRPGYDQLGVQLVADIHARRGPIGGLHSALVHGAGRAVFLLACDLPFVTPDLVRFIVGRHPAPASPPTGGQASGADATVCLPSLAGSSQPLCALYSAGCLPVVERQILRGRLGMYQLLGCLQTVQAEIDASSSLYHPRLLANLNSPEDLDAAATMDSNPAPASSADG